MAEGKPFPWRMTALALAGVLVVTAAGAGGAYLGGVRLDRRGDMNGPRGPEGFQTPAGEERLMPLAGLSMAQRREIRQRIGEAWRAAAPYREESSLARQEVLQVVGEDPYDPAAVRDALARMRAADAASTAAVHDALAEAMAGLSAEEREALLLASSRWRGRWSGRGPDRRDPQEPDQLPPPAPQAP